MLIVSLEPQGLILRDHCECEEAGTFNSGIKGTLVGALQDGNWRYVERCDACERFESDDEACAHYTSVLGGRCSHDLEGRALWVAS